MASTILVALGLAACGLASVLPQGPSPGFLSLPISHKTTETPLLSKRSKDIPLYNLSSVSYLISLSLGTPGQTVRVAVDTGSDEFWVDPNCASKSLEEEQQEECRRDGHYYASSSSTSTPLQAQRHIPYGKGQVLIDYYTDTVSQPDGSITLNKIQFGVANKSQDLSEGILGLGFGIDKNLKYPNFVDELVSQKVTNTRAFSIALGSVDANNGGIIIFGGVDTKKFSGKLAKLPMLPPQSPETVHRYWVDLGSIAITQGGKSKVYPNSSTPLVLDSGSSLSYLPTGIVKSMASDLGGRLHPEIGLYLVPCGQVSKTNSFDFTFSGNKFSVPLSEFIWKVDGDHCVLGAAPVDPSSGVTALLGDTFMRSAYVVFDQTSEALFMAPYANCGQNEQVIPAGANGAVNFSGECEPKKNGGGRGGGNSGNSVTAVVAAVVGLQAFMRMF